LIQKSIRPDSIVPYSYSTVSARRLLQQNRPQADMIMRKMLPSASEVLAAFRSVAAFRPLRKLIWRLRRPRVAPTYPKVEPTDPKVLMTLSYNGFTVARISQRI